MNRINIANMVKSTYLENDISCVPISVSFEITTKCNLKCKHCYNQFSKENVELKLNDKIKLVNIIKELGAVELTLCGGEPMLSKDFIYIVKHAKEKGLILNILTNGFFANDDIMLALNETLTKYDTIQISVDDYYLMKKKQRDINEKDYKKVLDNIIKFQTLKCFTYISITPTIYNQLYILDILKYLHENARIYAFGATPYLPFGGIRMDNLKPNYGYLYDVEKDVSDYCFKNNISYLGGVSGHPCQQLMFNSEKRKKDNQSMIRKCSAAMYNIHISCDGSIFPCVFMSDDCFCFAHINDNIETIKENMNEINKKINNYHMPHKCIECDRIAKCNGGCLGLVFDRYSNLLKVDPRCEIK